MVVEAEAKMEEGPFVMVSCFLVNLFFVVSGGEKRFY